jgi:hypothetical protein
MAFHSKGGNISRSSRTNRRDKESILGLSGWLFADLLLAIAVIFLVVQEKPGTDPPPTTTTSTTSTVPTENDGLLADPEKQLFVTVRNGLTTVRKDSFMKLLDSRNTSVLLGEKGKKQESWASIREQGYRVGMVIWFARTSELSGITSRRHLSNLVEYLLENGLIDKNYLPKIKGTSLPDTSKFPNISNYEEKTLGNSLKFRIFLYQPRLPY